MSQQSLLRGSLLQHNWDIYTFDQDDTRSTRTCSPTLASKGGHDDTQLDLTPALWTTVVHVLKHRFWRPPRIIGGTDCRVSGF